MPRPKKEVFRKDYIDLIVILPSQQGKVVLGKDSYSTIRVPLSKATDVEYMNLVFRQLWVTLAKDDKLLSKEFAAFFKNEAIAKKRADKLIQKMMMKANTEKTKAIDKKLEENAKSENCEEISKEAKDGSALDKEGATH